MTILTFERKNLVKKKENKGYLKRTPQAKGTNYYQTLGYHKLRKAWHTGYWFVYCVYLIFIVLFLFINILFYADFKMQSVFGGRT